MVAQVLPILVFRRIRMVNKTSFEMLLYVEVRVPNAGGFGAGLVGRLS